MCECVGMDEGVAHCYSGSWGEWDYFYSGGINLDPFMLQENL